MEKLDTAQSGKPFDSVIFGQVLSGADSFAGIDLFGYLSEALVRAEGEFAWIPGALRLARYQRRGERNIVYGVGFVPNTFYLA